MDANDKVVAELVQTRISVSPDQYKDVYNQKMHPILMAQPGMIATMAGVVTSENDQDSTKQADGATVLSLVIWKNVDSHIGFITGKAAGPFFEASMPLMRDPPSVEHYEVDGLQPSAFHSHYAQVLKASSANSKELLESVFQRHVATEGENKVLFSDCTEDASKKALVLFSDSDQFEATAGVLDKGTGIGKYDVKWYSRGTTSYL
ncbi:hypothetical protein TGAM01_v207410 [Trichoderma gamsii]|uniref:EthD domain-containing protein n=1 Tax=Trichoderma gamsii TaxID=398673 RepID=A0A2P4ZHK9_9HYPO|nr:hypothetical protein TGAM01_v207410 [Trichoderma gamsii]PON23763.1 hypothetical protein TGAM01_v207410 [Trichoderma gamsii]